MQNIVIIEEDQLMRALLVEWLSAAGYSVRAAAPGDGRSPSRADLVIVDVYRPRHEGAKLRAVKAAYPETPLIAISGHFRSGLVGCCSAADALGVQQVVAKPFARRELLAAVKDVIGVPGALTGT